MLLARYLHHKKPPLLFTPLLFARRTYANKTNEGPLTLRPESLVAHHRLPLDFSNCTARTVHRVTVYYSGNSLRFPAGSKGFLYYQPGSTELSGQLRMRICDDASSFNTGHDLLIFNRPWGFHLVNLLRNPRFIPLVDTIVKDGFVSPQTIANMRVRLADTGKAPYRHVLCALSDPFYIQLDSITHNLTIVTEQNIRVARLLHTFSTSYKYKHKYDPSRLAVPAIAPFTGTLQVRFELSNLPEHAFLGPTLVLKILEVNNLCHVREDITILKPPVAGEYHYRFPYGKSTMWRLCIDEIEDAREAFGPLLDLPGIVYAD